MYFLLIVETIDLILRRQYKIAPQVLHTVGRAGAGSAAHLLGLQHLGVRTGHEMNVKSALGVADFPLKLGLFIAGMGSKTANQQPTSRYHPKSCASRVPQTTGTTSNRIFMPSCILRLQITVHTHYILLARIKCHELGVDRDNRSPTCTSVPYSSGQPQQAQSR